MQVVHPNSLQTGAVVGKCILCSNPHDDYGPRHRCSKCRMLVLLCPACAAQSIPACDASETVPSGQHTAASSDPYNDATQNGAAAGEPLICDICRSRQAVAPNVPGANKQVLQTPLLRFLVVVCSSLVLKSSNIKASAANHSIARSCHTGSQITYSGIAWVSGECFKVPGPPERPPEEDAA